MEKSKEAMAICGTVMRPPFVYIRWSHRRDPIVARVGLLRVLAFLLTALRVPADTQPIRGLPEIELTRWTASEPITIPGLISAGPCHARRMTVLKGAAAEVSGYPRDQMEVSLITDPGDSRILWLGSSTAKLFGVGMRVFGLEGCPDFKIQPNHAILEPAPNESVVDVATRELKERFESVMDSPTPAQTASLTRLFGRERLLGPSRRDRAEAGCSCEITSLQLDGNRLAVAFVNPDQDVFKLVLATENGFEAIEAFYRGTSVPVLLGLSPADPFQDWVNPSFEHIPGADGPVQATRIGASLGSDNGLGNRAELILESVSWNGLHWVGPEGCLLAYGEDAIWGFRASKSKAIEIYRGTHVRIPSGADARSGFESGIREAYELIRKSGGRMPESMVVSVQELEKREPSWSSATEAAVQGVAVIEQKFVLMVALHSRQRTRLFAITLGPSGTMEGMEESALTKALYPRAKP